MAVQPDSCGTWSENLETGFLTTRLIYDFEENNSGMVDHENCEKNENSTSMGDSTRHASRPSSYACGVPDQ